MRRRTEGLLNSRLIRAKSKKHSFFIDSASLPPTPAPCQLQCKNRFGPIEENPPLHNYHLCIILAFALHHPNLLPISLQIRHPEMTRFVEPQPPAIHRHQKGPVARLVTAHREESFQRSEERRVGNECRSRWS